MEKGAKRCLEKMKQNQNIIFFYNFLNLEQFLVNIFVHQKKSSISFNFTNKSLKQQ